MTLYMVASMKEEIALEGIGIESILKMSWADGMVGAVPVFEDYDSALKYCEDYALITEVHFTDGGE